MTIAVMVMTGKKEFFKSSPSRIKVTTHEIAEYEVHSECNGKCYQRALLGEPKTLKRCY